SAIENNLADAQISLQIECGSGSVLTGLAKRQAQKITTLATDTVAKLDNIKQQLSAQ
ncbi:[acyl-carrier-protein] S-malonyltransferase, partial [Salmonella enterica subsp. enterica]|nr:[acyl-carrier-protein] S-malonyltransferase [Salmonella enterica subsp. enterica]